MNRNYLIAVAGTVVVLLATVIFFGCATIMHGTSQEIGIQSRPTGATVTINNQEYGKTPVVAKLSRKDNHTVHLTLDGYQPFDATITRSTSGWVWGNIVFGGLIGLAVDAISGGLYKLSPEQVEAELAGKGMGMDMQGSDIIITVVLEPDPSWEKVGNLLPAN
ncbi:MAG: PEGA domain-containing protein [Deltaproteobacteria bacterium]|nr:PEGA domain-containing protein [Deltaproteobacteria bacterium]